MISATTVNPQATTSVQGAGGVALRVAFHGRPESPPEILDLRANEPAPLIERAFEQVAAETHLPVLAIRETIENLVHASFAGALVSVLDGGNIVRVSDHGPGIPRPDVALLAGFTTASADLRTIIRGVGCGLGLAAAAMAAANGHLVISDNLGQGTVVSLQGADNHDLHEPRVTELSQEARLIMALLTDVGLASVDTLSAELILGLSDCGRELVALEQRGLVTRSNDGTRGLTRRGTDLIASLF